MGSSDDKVLPLIDRDTPVLDRIRGRGEEADVAQSVGKMAGEAALNDDTDFIVEQAEDFRSGFVSSLTEELGVDEDDVSVEYVDDVVDAVIAPDVSDILTDEALVSIGIKDGDSSDEEEEGSSSF